MTPEEYNEAVDSWADDVYRFALSCCRDGDRSNDAVQEAFAKLWEMRESIEKSRCKGFLIMVVQNKLKDTFRHDRVVSETHEKLSHQHEDRATPIETIDLRDALEKAMALLTEQQRTIITLHDLEGYQYEEIATMMKMNYSQVQVTAFRARVRMKKTLLNWGIV